MQERFDGSITDVRGIRVGQVQDVDARTGVTAVLCDGETMGGVDVRGAAPGTRETDLLRPGNLVQGPHAVLLCGGSAYGLAAADGAMRYLREHGIGLDVGLGIVPIVPAAVLFDLSCGRADVFPDAGMGYAACAAASAEVTEGRWGAGCGATVGKLLQFPGVQPSLGGVGTASLRVGKVTVAAIVAVNAAGDIYHPHTGALLAGAIDASGAMLRAEEVLFSGAVAQEAPGRNTTIGVVATDARLTKEQAARLATVAHDGYARCIRPAHTQIDGDTIFSVATALAEDEPPFVALCAAAAEVMARAVANAVWAGGRP